MVQSQSKPRVTDRTTQVTANTGLRSDSRIKKNKSSKM